MTRSRSRHRTPGATTGVNLGVTLLEVVLATGIAAVFLTAFIVQYRVQQSSFQIASDELRLPPQGYMLANRMLGCFPVTSHSAMRPPRFNLTGSKCRLSGGYRRLGGNCDLTKTRGTRARPALDPAG